MNLAGGLLIAAIVVVGYSYAGYPAILWLVAATRKPRTRPSPPAQWPFVSLTVPVYNEAAIIRGKLERVLEYDYPRDRLQILVVSDASNDGTEEIVREFVSRGIDLVQLARRGGKTAAENAALPYLRGEIVVNCDASIAAPPSALKEMIVWFGDPTVGVVSGRDVSVTKVVDQSNLGESGYVGYEMWVRRLETRVSGIIGASGCFYAIRKHLHQELVPEALSRDFAAPLVARERGYRSVSADDAVVFVPRTPSLRQEYRRKVRTMTRGLETLFYKRALMNPLRYGAFAWMLLSHKLIRWLVPWAAAVAAVALAVLAFSHPVAAWIVGLGVVVCVVAAVGWLLPRASEASRLISVPTFMLAGLIGGMHAWIKALQGDLNPIWEPTRRDPVTPR